MPSSTKEWLSVKEVCATLSVSRHSVYRLIHSGHLRAKNMSVKEGNALWRVHIQWLQEFRDTIAQPE